MLASVLSDLPQRNSYKAPLFLRNPTKNSHQTHLPTQLLRIASKSLLRSYINMPASISSKYSSTHGSAANGTAGKQRADDLAARAIYLKIMFGGLFMVVLLIFAVLSIFWGSLWKIPDHQLPGWIVDFDGSSIGQTVASSLSSQSTSSKIAWTVVPASQFSGGVDEVASMVLNEHTWVAIVIQEGASSRLSQSLASPNASYDGSDAISVFAVEGRNENAFRSIIRPQVQGSLDSISGAIALKTAQQVANSTNVASVLTTSPQTVTVPVSYRIINLAPFDIPVATAVTFVGLIYQLIIAFFVVMLSYGAREAAGYDKNLPTRTLITLRLATSFFAYFALSIFYSLLSVAFQLDMSRKFGHAGFFIFWMLNYVSMLACGLALESLITLLTPKFIPFFMLTWIITNVSVCVFPIEVMPHIFRYGYAAPFYNVSRAMRTVIFGTKNQVGLSFGILLIWVAISCVTMLLLQWLVRRKSAAPTEAPLLGTEKTSMEEASATV